MEWNGQRWQLHLSDVMDGSIRPGIKNKEQRGVLFFGALFRFSGTSNQRFFLQTQLKMMSTLVLSVAGHQGRGKEVNSIAAALEVTNGRFDKIEASQSLQVPSPRLQDAYYNVGWVIRP